MGRYGAPYRDALLLSAGEGMHPLRTKPRERLDLARTASIERVMRKRVMNSANSSSGSRPAVRERAISRLSPTGSDFIRCDSWKTYPREFLRSGRRECSMQQLHVCQMLSCQVDVRTAGLGACDIRPLEPSEKAQERRQMARRRNVPDPDGPRTAVIPPPWISSLSTRIPLRCSSHSSWYRIPALRQETTVLGMERSWGWGRPITGTTEFGNVKPRVPASRTRKARTPFLRVSDLTKSRPLAAGGGVEGGHLDKRSSAQTRDLSAACK